MKISGTGSTERASGSGKAGGTKKTGSTGFSGLLEGTDETGATGATYAIARMDALLAAQGVDDPAERASRGRMMLRADDVLDELEGVRRHLLSGTLTVGHMVDIADVVASHREKIADPQLTALLDEIDLRAQIELAKMAKTLAAKDVATREA
jgi:hypothetical protein